MLFHLSHSSSPYCNFNSQVIRIYYRKDKEVIRHWWLTPIILATWKAKIGRIVVLSQPRQKVFETPILMDKKLGWAWWCVLVIP
jgi:hypothetical protein